MERVAVDGNENDKGWFMVIIKKEKKRRERREIFHSSISKNEKKLEDDLWINLLIIVKYSFIYLFVFFFDKYLITLENFHIILINLIIFILYIIHHVYTLFRSYIYKYIF